MCRWRIRVQRDGDKGTAVSAKRAQKGRRTNLSLECGCASCTETAESVDKVDNLGNQKEAVSVSVSVREHNIVDS